MSSSRSSQCRPLPPLTHPPTWVYMEILRTGRGPQLANTLRLPVYCMHAPMYQQRTIRLTRLTRRCGAGYRVQEQGQPP